MLSVYFRFSLITRLKKKSEIEESLQQSTNGKEHCELDHIEQNLVQRKEVGSRKLQLYPRLSLKTCSSYIYMYLTIQDWCIFTNCLRNMDFYQEGRNDGSSSWEAIPNLQFKDENQQVLLLGGGIIWLALSICG